MDAGQFVRATAAAGAWRRRSVRAVCWARTTASEWRSSAAGVRGSQLWPHFLAAAGRGADGADVRTSYEPSAIAPRQAAGRPVALREGLPSACSIAADVETP
jgi:hypothetical protein